MVDETGKQEVFENIKSKHNPVSNYDSGVGETCKTSETG